MEILKKINRFIYLFKGIFKDTSYFKASGYFNSFISGKPVDKDGNPIPWMVYSMIAFLKERLNKEMSVLEYGSGFSSYWIAPRVKKLISVESDTKWYEISKQMLDKFANAQIINEPNLVNYVQSAATLNQLFDVIIVDGVDETRVDCMKNSVKFLSKNGVMILDDSTASHFEEAFTFMESLGYKRIIFTGFKPFTLGHSDTTVFYKDGNCFGI